MAVILVMMQLAKKIPFENPEILMLVRGFYVLSNLIILSIYLFTQKKITTKKGTYAPLPLSMRFLLHLILPSID